MNVKQFIVGSSLILMSGISLIINISVLFVLIRHFLKHNSIYVLAITIISGNIVQVFLVFVYLGPTSLFQADILPPIANKFFSFIFLALWYIDMAFILVMALNRFLTVVYQKEKFFTRTCCWVISAIIYSAGFVTAFCGDYVISCCTAYIDYKVYSYTYLEPGYNYVNNYIDMPVNVTSSSVCSVPYITIFIYVRRVNKSNTAISYAVPNHRRKREVRYALQFAACSVMACVAWILFRILPVIIHPKAPYLRSLIVHFLIGHYTANSLIFIIFNAEVSFYTVVSCTVEG
uniref:7TM_GPCR_Srx domain-containing protein n=1 Tax=Panagrellus redivivus TaxID=6233 RepID=A0A7E4VSD9_PANRE